MNAKIAPENQKKYCTIKYHQQSLLKNNKVSLSQTINLAENSTHICLKYFLLHNCSSYKLSFRCRKSVKSRWERQYITLYQMQFNRSWSLTREFLCRRWFLVLLSMTRTKKLQASFLGRLLSVVDTEHLRIIYFQCSRVKKLHSLSQVNCVWVMFVLLFVQVLCVWVPVETF